MRHFLLSAIASLLLAACIEPSVTPTVTPPRPTDTATPVPIATSTETPIAPTNMPATETPTAAATSVSCQATDQDAYVYNPNRLTVLAPCITITGIVESMVAEADGDLHIRLRLDPPFANLLTPANANEGGNLVIEPVCVGKVTQTDAMATCASDPDPLLSHPSVGQHVWMQGRYVTDNQHGGWAELHPLYRFGLQPDSITPTATPHLLTQSTSLLPTAVPELAPTSNALPFTGTLLIADAGNNRLIEVNRDKQILWSFPIADSLPITRHFRYPDDAFFSPDGKYIAVNEESNQVISVIDYATRKLVWQFGVPGVPGSDLHHLHTPDDAHILLDGSIAVADIRNCRILIISWDQTNIKSLGSNRDCSGAHPGSFASPNGVTPLANGHLLITEIHTRRASEIDREGNVIRSVVLPIRYPSDAFLTWRDTLIVASYIARGPVIEADWAGHVLWTFPPKGSPEYLDRSSIAIELPNGNIVISDDHRHRVIVVNRRGNILWQYGVTDQPGTSDNHLFIPDGFDWHSSG